MDWLGLDIEKHNRKKQLFVPSKSINNTQIWKRISCNVEDVKFIEKELEEFLYDFPL
jgi:hypothetical protein